MIVGLIKLTQVAVRRYFYRLKHVVLNYTFSRVITLLNARCFSICEPNEFRNLFLFLYSRSGVNRDKSANFFYRDKSKLLGILVRLVS